VLRQPGVGGGLSTHCGGRVGGGGGMRGGASVGEDDEEDKSEE